MYAARTGKRWTGYCEQQLSKVKAEHVGHTKKVVILVDLLKQLKEILEVLVCSMAFLDGGVQNCCQALVLLH